MALPNLDKVFKQYGDLWSIRCAPTVSPMSTLSVNGIEAIVPIHPTNRGSTLWTSKT